MDWNRPEWPLSHLLNLEIVLGTDNIIFISILTNKLSGLILKPFMEQPEGISC